MAELIDRPALKAEMKELLGSAQVSPKGFVGLYLLLMLALRLVDSLASSGSPVTYGNPLGSFVSILTSLLGVVLQAGFILYCMDIRRGVRSGYLTLFDGFSFAGRVIGLAILETLFIFLWLLLFVGPGIVAAYRYRFAYLNLCENPELGCMDALELSKKQTMGYKGQLFTLDLSYLGWGLLATLPMSVWGGYFTAAQSSSLLNSAAPGSTGVSLGLDLLCGLWAVVIQIFYLPTYQCTQLGYYETAKRTSGVSPLPVNQRGIEDG
ncbi:MAG: DUF975 family protein, partial [Oscillibacter sp.]